MVLQYLPIPETTRRRLRPIAHRTLEVTGLIGLLHRRAERQLAQTTGGTAEDGLAMPPPELLVLVAGTADPGWFSARGRADAERFSQVAAAHGIDLSQAKDVWDLGCGCGRIARWLAPAVIAAGGSFTGSDINQRLVDWTAAHLPGQYVLNRLRPPTSLAKGSIDLVYAYSVLTHLREDAVVRWLREVQRVVRPGGLALLTFHDEGYASAWGVPGMVQAMAEKNYIVLNNALEGSNYMSAWVTRRHFEALASGAFEVLEIIPGSLETPMQALAVLRRRPCCGDGPS